MMLQSVSRESEYLDWEKVISGMINGVGNVMCCVITPCNRYIWDKSFLCRGPVSFKRE